MAQQTIGSVVSLHGAVQAVSAEGTRILAQGGEVLAGEKVVTGAGAAVEIRFADQTTLSQGENSTIALDDYVYDAHQPQSSKLLFKLIKRLLKSLNSQQFLVILLCYCQQLLLIKKSLLLLNQLK